MEHDEQADRLERDADKMEQESERVGGRIEETRSDWESKETSQSVPGAQAALPGEEDDEDEATEDGEPEGDESSGEDSDQDEESE